jgi:putative nucleotidyltransferase with HDIG domain
MLLTDLIDFKNCEYKWDVIENIPEFSELKKCEQNPKWHSEGNAWNHTKKVCEQAERLIPNYFNIDDCKALMGAALFHDIGKGVTTEFKKGNWHSYGHEIQSEIITRNLLFDEDILLREEICRLVRWHMDILKVFESKHYAEKILDLSTKVNLRKLIDLKKCDILGSIPEDFKVTEYDKSTLEKINTIAENLNCLNKPTHCFNIKQCSIERFRKSFIDVHIMIGVPGAGKSTTIENYIRPRHDDWHKIHGTELVVVSRDIARYKLGFCGENEKYLGTPKEEEEVTKYCNNLIKEAADNGKCIVIDNTNLKRKYRDSVKELLKDYKVFYFYHYIEAASLEENFKRREGEVPSNVIINMLKSLEWPTYDEYLRFYIHKNNEVYEIRDI